MALSTNGVQLWYVASEGGTTPVTTGYSVFSRAITDFPGFASTTDSIETTPIDEENYKQYVAGLGDPGGSADMTINCGVDEFAEVVKIQTEADGATEKGVLWFAVVHPLLTDKAFIFKGTLGNLSIPAVTSNTAFQCGLSITPNFMPKQPQPKPTLKP